MIDKTNPHLTMTWKIKLKKLIEAGHIIEYSISGANIGVSRYDEFTFKKGDKIDQGLAKEMMNLDYDILWLKAQEK